MPINFPSSIDSASTLFTAVNNLATALNGALDASATTVTVLSTSGFPTVGWITIDQEAIYYSSTTGTTFINCTRGAGGTVAATHIDTSAVKHTVVADHHNMLKDATIALEQYLSDRFGLTADVVVPSTKNFGVGAAPSFKFDVQGASITGRFRSSTGPVTLDVGTGSSGTVNDVALKFSDGVGATWAIGHDASQSNRLSFSASSTLGTNEKLYMTTAGILRSLYRISVGESWNGDDCPINVNQDGVTTRPGIQTNHRNTAMSRVPVFIAQNFDAAGNGNGNCLAFYGRDGVSDIQHGILAFSQKGATTANGRFELMLASGGNSLPCMQMEGSGTIGYAYTLFGPGPGAGDFTASYAYGAYTPSSTVHVASDTGDVDSGIRLQSLRYPGRFNFIINTSGNMEWREVDVVGKGVTLAKTTGLLTVAGQLVAKGTATNDSAGAGYMGEFADNTVSTYTNVGTTLEFANITSISLTAGDWDVAGQVEFAVNGATSVGEVTMAISTSSGNTTTDHVAGKNVLKQRPPVTGANSGIAIGRHRVSLSATTTVYLKGMTSYTAGNPQYVGTITARRVR